MRAKRTMKRKRPFFNKEAMSPDLVSFLCASVWRAASLSAEGSEVLPVCFGRKKMFTREQAMAAMKNRKNTWSRPKRRTKSAQRALPVIQPMQPKQRMLP